jgi:hypothetical protein
VADLAESATERKRKIAYAVALQHFAPRIVHILDDSELKSLDKDAAIGWAMTNAFGALFVVFDSSWPFSAPEIFIDNLHPNFEGVHVDGTGKVCLAPLHSTYSQSDPIQVIEHLLNETEELFRRGLGSDEEFVDEFQSYWLRDMKPKEKSFSLLKLPGPSRMVSCFHGKSYAVYADDPSEIEDWLSRKYKVTDRVEIMPEPLIWFPRGLVPAEYPKRAGQFWRLVKQLVPEALPLLSKAGGQNRNTQRIIFGFDTSNGPALGEIILKRPKKFSKGFRAGKLSNAIATARFYGAEKTEAGYVSRVDHEWIHSRGGERSHIDLKNKKAIIVGCGALGSGVAMQLAKAGVGNLVLVDDDILKWDNLARHALGAKFVGQNKAEAMSIEINQQMPTVRATSVASSWQKAVKNGILKINDADVIITTTGDWVTDSMLNFEARQNLNAAPLVIGWLEDHAVAGHALAIMDVGGCFACGTNEFGVFLDRLSYWPQSTMMEMPACGGQYQPYGSGYLATTQALVATTAINVINGKITKSELSSWICSRSSVEELGGQWTEKALVNLSYEGGFLKERWGCNSSCELC